MVTYVDIRKAINAKLLSLGAEVNSRDVTEGFNRPSFFVQFDNNVRSGNVDQMYKSFTVTGYYFPTDRYEYAMEVMTKQEELENLFDMKLKVLTRYLNINDFNTTLADGVLNFSFDIEFFEGRKYQGLENDFVKNVIIGNEKYKEETGREFHDDYPTEIMEVLETKRSEE